MVDQLPGLGTGGTEAHTVYDVIKSALKEVQQVFTRRAFLLRRFFIVIAKLLFQHTVHATHFLLLAQLNGVVRRATTLCTLHTWRAFVLALGLKRANARLQVQICTFAAAQYFSTASRR